MSGVYNDASEIDGVGVFADEYFGEGWFIGTIAGFVSAKPDHHCQHTVWIADERGRTYGLCPEPPFRFLNHSEESNAEVDGANVYALQTIKPGDEITIFYGEGWLNEQDEDDDDGSVPEEEE